MKDSYKNRRLDGLFTYYPVQMVSLTNSTRSSLEEFRSAHRLNAEYERLNEKVPLLLDVDTGLGLEIEAEQVKKILVDNPAPFFNVTSDNSLRNEGYEFVSMPIKPTLARESLLTLWAMFNRYPPDFSWRTSDHVHLNMRNDRVEQLMNFIILYVLVEDSLFDFIGKDRRESNFCVPIQETNLSMQISQVLHGKQHIPDLCKQWNKYTALNPRPLVFNDHSHHSGDGGKGTIELRHMEGTNNLQKFVNWINLILCLQTTARKTRISDLEERIFRIESKKAYVEILEETFGPYSALLMPVKDFQNILYKSVAYAKECFFPVPNIAAIIKAGKEKETGLAETIKIRTRFKKPDEKKKDVEIGVPELGNGVSIPVPMQIWGSDWNNDWAWRLVQSTINPLGLITFSPRNTPSGIPHGTLWYPSEVSSGFPYSCYQWRETDGRWHAYSGT